MLHSNAIINGKTYDLLEYSQQEHPLAIQLGGADPKSLSEAASIAEDFGYSEINLIVGCPSSKVQKGKFGAVLMKEPQLVSSCVNEIIKSVKIPVTVKCRIGVDDMDEDTELDNFIKQVKGASFTDTMTLTTDQRTDVTNLSIDITPSSTSLISVGW